MFNRNPLELSKDKEKSLDRLQVSSHPLLPSKPKEAQQIKQTNVQVLGGKSKSGGNVASVSATSESIDPLSSPLSSIAINDPLSSGSVSVSNDPLSMMASMNTVSSRKDIVSMSTKRDTPTSSAKLNTPAPQRSQTSIQWLELKTRIMRDFSVSGSIKLGANAVNEFSGI